MVAEIILWGLAIAASVAAYRRSPAALAEGGRRALGFARALSIRLPLAILAAAFVAQILPRDIVGGAIGAGSGALGVLIASAAGALMPGGPFIAFPLAVSFYEAGAGLPQIVALITAWSVLGFVRIVSYEWPMLGPRFVALRIASTVALPPLAAALTAAMLMLGAHG